MARIIVSEFISIDGVIEAPYEWQGDLFHEEMGVYKDEELFASGALLLGRVTYQGFAAAWPTMEDAGAYGEYINAMPKVVVSSTLTDPSWGDVTVLRDDLPAAIGALRERDGRPLLVFGSADLVNLLVAHDLADELRLMIHPVVAGKGKRLFADETVLKGFTLTDSRTFPTGVVVLTYERATGETALAVASDGQST